MTQITSTKVVANAVRLLGDGGVFVPKVHAVAVELQGANNISSTKVVAYAISLMTRATYTTKVEPNASEVRWPLSGIWYRTAENDWVAILPYANIGTVRATEDDDIRVTEDGRERVVNGAGDWRRVRQAYAKQAAQGWGRTYPMELLAAYWVDVE